MKLLIASDIHGSAFAARNIVGHFYDMKCDYMLLLGDILYHGPRNGVPGTYSPNDVVRMLNERKENILAVKGNCDCDVDQMLLEFPIMAEYSQLVLDGRRFFLTHGHLYHRDYLPPLPVGSVFVQGHTHVPALEELPGGITFLNPGSISLPKGGSANSFAFYDNGEISLKKLA